MLKVLVVAVLYLYFVSDVSAEVLIRDFYASQTDDWVEIVNTSEAEVDVSGYSLEDTAKAKPQIYKWEGVVIPPGGNCVASVGRRINNAGDTVYLKNSQGEEIDCVKHKSGNGGVCVKERGETENSGTLVSSCFEKVEDDVEEVEPVVVEKLMPKLASPTGEINKMEVLGEESFVEKEVLVESTPVPRTKATTINKEITKKNDEIEQMDVEDKLQDDGINLIGVGMISTGVIMISFGAYLIFREKLYNNDTTNGGKD